MKSIIVVLAAFGLSTFSIAEETASIAGDKPWKVVKSEEAPANTEFRFAANGKLTVSIPSDGKKTEMTGTYTLSGTKLVLKIMHDGRERVDTRTIKKLTADVLITEDKNKKVEEMHR